MKTIKFLLLLSFCTLSAGIAVNNVFFQVLGVISCIVMVAVFLAMRRKEKEQEHLAQLQARQGLTPDQLFLEYNDQMNASIWTMLQMGIKKSREEMAADAMKIAMETLIKKYGFTMDELTGILFGGQDI